MYPWPYLDRAGFVLRSAMPASDVAIVEMKRPGFLFERIAMAQSMIEARLRKRYRRSLPLGGAAPQLYSSGTTPPGAKLLGVPQFGSCRLYLQITTAGNDGAAAFQWSLDAGRTFVGSLTSLSVTAAGIGYASAPPVTIDPPAVGGTQATATATIDDTGAVDGLVLTNAGSGYTQVPRVTLGAGPTPQQSAFAVCDGTTAIPVAIPAFSETAPVPVYLLGTGLSVLWGAGAYALDNLFQAPTPVPDAVLGWIVAIVTPEMYLARGVNTADPTIAGLIEPDRVRVLGTDGKQGELYEAADGENGLLDLPPDDALADTSAVSNGPLGSSEASPYVAFDVEVRRARAEDARFGGRGGFNGSPDE